MKLKALLILCLLLTVVLLAGCTAHTPTRGITVYAQRNLGEAFKGYAAEMREKDDVKVELVVGLNQELMEKLAQASTADVVVLGSKASVDQLKKEKVIDNYRLFRHEGTDYYIAKTIASRHYAYGQRFADLVLAGQSE